VILRIILMINLYSQMKRQVNIAFRQSFNALVHGTTKDASRVKKQAIMSYQESDTGGLERTEHALRVSGVVLLKRSHWTTYEKRRKEGVLLCTKQSDEERVSMCHTFFALA